MALPLWEQAWRNRKTVVAVVLGVWAAIWALGGALMKDSVVEYFEGAANHSASIDRLDMTETGRFNDEIAPFWWAVRVRFSAEGLHGKTIKFVPWLYDAQTTGRLIDFRGTDGKARSWITVQPKMIEYVKVSAKTQNQLVRINVPVPMDKGNHRYYVGVALITGKKPHAEELDYKITKPIAVTRKTLLALDKIFEVHAARQALDAQSQ